MNSYGNDDRAKEFGIKVMNQLVLVDARVLPTPRVYHIFYLLKLWTSFQLLVYIQLTLFVSLL